MKFKQLFFLILATILIGFSNVGKAEEVVNREYCYFGAGMAYSHSDKTLGALAKFAFPMQKGFYFVAQATYLPPMLDFNYKEFRYEIYFELVPFRIKKFEFFAHTGFDWGMWIRTTSSLYQDKMDSYFKDESLLFGGGIQYNFKGLSFYADYKYFPTIASAHSSLGIKYKIFENRSNRQAYYRYLRRKKDLSPAEKS